jgi:pyruvate/2-oxoglutarate dehydrogenase complex dihydrolipoamide acyltransferase (E2) component
LLNPPEVAILGIGQIRKRAVVVNENIEVRSTAFFCLATDHRVVDAEPAGEFLRCLDGLLAGG